MSHPYQLRSMDSQLEETELHLVGAGAARFRVLPELASGNSDVGASSSGENVSEGAAVGASTSTE